MLLQALAAGLLNRARRLRGGADQLRQARSTNNDRKWRQLSQQIMFEGKIDVTKFSTYKKVLKI